MIAERPLSGQGPGSFLVNYPRFRPPEIIRLEGRHNTETDHPECQLLEVAAELGVVGAALWAWLFAALLAAAWRARRALINQGALGESCYMAGLFAATTCFLIASTLSLGS
jgi:O-antigen ligase